MKLGLLGGTFDPIHLGHLMIAEGARSQLGLERVLLVPTGVPWLRRGEALSPGRHRLAMARLAVAGDPHLEVSALEVERPGNTYTVDTLQELRRRLGPEATPYFILGMDTLNHLPSWREPRRVLELCHLVVVDRPGYPTDLGLLDELSPGAGQRAIRLALPLIGISAQEIRRRVAQGLSIRYWVPQAVEEYIVEHGLYRGEE